MSELAMLVSRALRDGSWKPENPPPFFHMARGIAKHARRGFDTTALEKALAFTVYAEMAGDARPERRPQPLFEMAREIFDACMPDDFGPVYKLASERARSAGAIVPGPATFQYAVLEHIERDTVARLVEFGDPYETIHAAVNAAAVLYPQLGLSFGYLGGVGPGCGEHGDDRSWQVFTKLATPRCVNACDVSFGSVDTDRIEDLASQMGDPFQAWLKACQADLDAGRVRTVGPRLAA
ncbi:hypothetical protein [Sphingomonas sp. 3-13AW]|uniref:hypothetical protein n=1 Tax=Sphingomonas sp. 3-13AW TaxID=3050450 RepID=UPI003BB7753E